jgi:PKD repeat protein
MSVQNPVHTYSSAGLYTVKLTITDGNGASNTRSIANAVSAIVSTPPVANFVSAPTQGTAPLSVTFTDASTSAVPITVWAWDFGDGTVSAVQNPVHQYSSPGLYTVILTVTNGYGSSNTKSISTAVSVSAPPVAAFTVTPTSGKAPLAVTFTDTSSFAIPIAGWVWDFGDGSQSTLRSPVHTYASAGSYTVKLTVTDGYGTRNMTSVPAAVSVGTSSPPVAQFTLTPTGGTLPLKVTFTDTSTSVVPITSWAWDFGDGTTSNLQNPVHIFQIAGAYPIHLTVTNENGVSSSN